MLQNLQVQNSGYKLLDKGNGIWQIQSPTIAFTGSYDQVMNYAVLDLGFEKREIELGRREMENKLDNVAIYGYFMKFMWTFDIQEAYAHYNRSH